MKIYKTIFPAVASAMLLTGCDDQIMEWGTPDGHDKVTTAEIPLAVKEVLANYDNIKAYAPANTVIAIGMGADLYCGNPDIMALATANYQGFTPGNAMKMGSMVSASGNINFETVDNLVDALQANNMQLYGHNFIWHTQQAQTYLKSLIAPKLVVESTSDIQTMLVGDAANFDGGTTGGWGSWGSNKESAEVVDGVGTDGSKAMVLTNKGDGNSWEAQFAYTFDTPLDATKEYTIRFKAKSTTAAGYLQFQYQNSTSYGSQGGYHDFSVGTDWTTCEFSFTPQPEPGKGDVDRIILNYGKVGGAYTIDDIEFGFKVEDPMETILAGDACDFEGGTTGGWGAWGSNKESADVQDGMGYDNSKGLVLVNKGDGNSWEAQCGYTFDTPLDETKSYIIQFWAKSSSAAGYLQFQYQNSTSYGSQGGYHDFPVGTDWVQCEFEFTPTPEPGKGDVDRILINFGKVGATYQIDNIKFGPAKNQSKAAVKARQKAAAKSYYVIKTPEEKREALLGAMDSWISGVAAHLSEKGIVPFGYDVINEPITDGDCKVRGVDGVFGGSWTDDDGVTHYDAEPTETEAEGLSLNWSSQTGNQHFYWGYYVKDYAVQAFQMARRYLPAETKLFVNDYNLESSPKKLEALINFVKKIDADNGAPIVDGIGTQMHVSIRPTDDAEKNAEVIADLKAKVDAQFQAMAATGKLVRITELDIALGTGSPSSVQYQIQAEAYRVIVRSYLENVPAAQQSGITIWSLSDNAAEHEYWLNGEVPNLFDANYLRKWAYKGFCDGLAGEDLGLKFGGDDYKAFYEKNNVSDTVK